MANDLVKDKVFTETIVLEQEPPKAEQEEKGQAETPAPAPPAELDPKAQKEKEEKIRRYMNEKITGQFTQRELDVLQNTIAQGTEKEEFRLFIQTCVNSGLNPFLNHIYPIVYSGENGRKLSMQISVEGIMFLARKVPGYRGVDVQLVHENDEFKMQRVDGKMTVAVHEFGLPRGQVVGGYAVARREGFEDAIVVMETSEVEKLKMGRNKRMWSDWFNDMFRKHILKRAAKEQYGIEVSEDEMATAAAPNPADYGTNVIRNEKRIETGEGESIPESKVKDNLWTAIYNVADNKAMNVIDMNDLIYDKFPGKNREDLNAQELAALLKFVEFFKKDEPKPQAAEGVKDIEFDDIETEAEPEAKPEAEPKDEFEDAFE